MRRSRTFTAVVTCIAAAVLLVLMMAATASSSREMVGARHPVPVPLADSVPKPSAGGGSSAWLVIVLLVALGGAGFVAFKKLRQPPARTNADHSVCIADWTKAGRDAQVLRHAAGDALGRELGLVERNFETLEQELGDTSRAFASLLPAAPLVANAPENDPTDIVLRVLAQLGDTDGAS